MTLNRGVVIFLKVGKNIVESILSTSRKTQNLLQIEVGFEPCVVQLTEGGQVQEDRKFRYLDSKSMKHFVRCNSFGSHCASPSAHNIGSYIWR